MRLQKSLLAIGVTLMLATPAPAMQLLFDGAWREQGFLRLSSNDYAQRGRSLDVRSDGTVSILYRPVPEQFRTAGKASWGWSVTDGVPPTDLTVKGGDDRNLALYFVFSDQETAAALGKRSLRRLLGDPNIRVLIYVWGGAHQRGQILKSPYLDTRGVTVIQRPAGTGDHSERVDLDADLRRAFGARPEALIGVAISSDSDDTETRVSAVIKDIRLN